MPACTLLPPRRLNAVVPKVVTATPEHSLQPLPLNLSYRTDHNSKIKIQRKRKQKHINFILVHPTIQKTLPRDFSMLKHNCKRLICSRTLPKDFCSRTTLRDFTLLKHNYLRLPLAQSQRIQTDRCSSFHQESYMLKHAGKILSKMFPQLQTS
ncbi:hypothetical protein MTR_6g055157 [Medicago truncatula]|uniref:Uncharacterized protein n=1 Tax=Medicago truncatula TaxID=3880 RepID=A0A072UAH4_MEDTR|nr:hypothetical protein MTR_6g055157 [Medicago truncatula]